MKRVVQIISISVMAFGWAVIGIDAGEKRLRVVASIKPVHSLAAVVMEGAGSPRLLVRGAASPHTYTLRPSDAAALQRADLVFWVAEAMEMFLTKPLAALPSKARVVQLSAVPGITLLPVRDGGLWPEEEEGDHHEEEGSIDMHIWLDSENAEAMVQAVAAALGAADPDRASLYQSNARGVRRRIQAMDAELRSRLRPVGDVPYVVFHDAYQYFERRYGLNPVTSISMGSGKSQGARRILEIQKWIRRARVVCVFAEPQFKPALIETVIEGTGIRTATLDPLGADLDPGPEQYFQMMRNMGESLLQGLSGKAR